MEKKRSIKLRELITDICDLYNTQGENAVYLDYGWCVYSSEVEITAESMCYVDDYPDYDDNDNEIYSDYIVRNNMELIYRDEMIQDVIIACLNQMKNVTVDEIVQALVYYEEYDNFLLL